MECLLPLELESARERNGQPDCNFRSVHGWSAPDCRYKVADVVRPEIFPILSLFQWVRNPSGVPALIARRTAVYDAFS